MEYPKWVKVAGGVKVLCADERAETAALLKHGALETKPAAEPEHKAPEPRRRR